MVESGQHRPKVEQAVWKLRQLAQTEGNNVATPTEGQDWSSQLVSKNDSRWPRL